jgi:hypothetical protein
MKGEKLFAALGNVDDRFIEEAAYPDGAVTTQTQTRARRAQRRRYFTLLAPVAACALLAAVILLPKWQNPTVGGGGQSVGGDNPDFGYRPSEGVTVPPRQPTPTLIMNTATSVSAAAAQYPEDHFNLDLSEEQLAAVFPGLNLTLGAGVHYSGDGSVVFVTALETLKPGRTDLPVQFKDAYYYTVITLGRGGIAVEDCVVYDADPKITVVDGVEVTAFRFDGRENDGVAFFQAEFTTNGVAYRVELHDSDDGEDGARRLTEIVCAVIRSAPAELSALENPEPPSA